jgi:hypothetical protein
VNRLTDEDIERIISSLSDSEFEGAPITILAQEILTLRKENERLKNKLEKVITKIKLEGF